MTVREVEERLESVRNINTEIKTLTASIESLRQSLVPSGIEYDKDRVQESHEDKMSGIFSKIDLFTHNKDIFQDKLNESVVSVTELISVLDDPKYIQVLSYWYIGDKRPFEIAELLGYSIDHIFYLRRKAVKRLSEITES